MVRRILSVEILISLTPQQVFHVLRSEQYAKLRSICYFLKGGVALQSESRHFRRQERREKRSPCPVADPGNGY